MRTFFITVYLSSLPLRLLETTPASLLQSRVNRCAHSTIYANAPLFQNCLFVRSSNSFRFTVSLHIWMNRCPHLHRYRNATLFHTHSFSGSSNSFSSVVSLYICVRNAHPLERTPFSRPLILQVFQSVPFHGCFTRLDKQMPIMAHPYECALFSCPLVLQIF